MEKNYKINFFDGNNDNQNNYVGSMNFSAMEEKSSAVARMIFISCAPNWAGENTISGLQYTYELV